MVILLSFGVKYGNQIVYSADGTTAYIAGADSNIYVMDSQTLSVVHTIMLSSNSNGRISDLAVVDGWLYMTEASYLEQSNTRLMRINIDQLSTAYLLEQQSVKFDFDAPFQSITSVIWR